jgi:hypothetical protein
MTDRGVSSRHEGDVRYYDYTPDTLRRYASRRDFYIAAEAFIYDRDVTDANATEKVAITVIVTGRELDIGTVSREEAIRRANAVREQAIAAHRAPLPSGRRAVVYGVYGQVIETKEEAV